MNDIGFASYADDDTPFIVGEDIGDVIFKLQNASKTFQWFYDNQVKANPDKWHFICRSNDKLNIVTEDQTISNFEILSRDFEILGWCPAGTFLPHGEKVPL